MHIEFKYRYYENEKDYEDYQLEMDNAQDFKIAYRLDEVGDVIHFAEQEQRNGSYVALYVTYEAAPFFNKEMVVNIVEQSHIFAAAYSFKSVNSIKNIKKVMPNKNHIKTEGFYFCESDKAMINKIKSIHKAIIEGATYQVNYTTRLKAEIFCPISHLYHQLTMSQNGNYTVLMDTPDIKVASISPELFFQKGDYKGKSNMIVSKPMKGTMPRGKNVKEDELYYNNLKTSSKDMAENVMIVDLLRNDITRIAQSGTIDVPELFSIEKYDTVFQMTSTVCGQLQDDIQLIDMMRALFPCGSITGAPKINTMQYIAQLEDMPRSIYCGTIGLLLPNQRMIFNIPIRTIEYNHEEAVYGVGAGITIDSIPENEVQEFHDKTKILERL